jgi:two-component system NtrC family response regulator
MANVLIIDDDPGMSFSLSNMVKNLGHEVVTANSVKDGRTKANSGSFDVVFLDVMMPDGSGLDLLQEVRETPSNPEVIIITAVGNPEGAELAISNGAWDYVEKPSSLKEMTLPMIRALQYREEKKARPKSIVLKRDNIIGSSVPIKECLNLLSQVAGSETTVLLTGETGTGKELFARDLHENSSRCEKSFVVIDCTALPETLVESMLFGHKKGAFTGADRAQEGLIKQADGGTLFLDEIGELPLSIQKRFLRALQEHRFRPIGGDKEVESQFRLVAATNRNLEEMAEQGQFRSDLLFRLRSFTIELPPLRNRGDDIKKLAIHHVTKICERYNTELKGFSPDFFEALNAYDWPGNVRELFNTLESIVTAAGNEPTLFPYHLPVNIRTKVTKSSLRISHEVNNDPGPGQISFNPGLENFPKIKKFRDNNDSQYLQALMKTSNGNRKEACRLSGLSRSRLFDLLKKYNISS